MARCSMLCALLLGCAASPPPPEPEPETPSTTGDEALAEPAPTEPPAIGEAQPEAPPVLPARFDAGTIERGVLLATLQEGIGRFLQRVQTQASFERGHFVGWRVVAFREQPSRLAAGVLRVGDMVMRVNGHSIERPEQFKNVWEAMRTSGELVFDIRREGRDSRVRYLVTDAAAPSSETAPAGPQAAQPVQDAEPPAP